jgi:hypothetical protein
MRVWCRLFDILRDFHRLCVATSGCQDDIVDLVQALIYVLSGTRITLSGQSSISESCSHPMGTNQWFAGNVDPTSILTRLRPRANSGTT